MDERLNAAFLAPSTYILTVGCTAPAIPEFVHCDVQERTSIVLCTFFFQLVPGPTNCQLSRSFRSPDMIQPQLSYEEVLENKIKSLYSKIERLEIALSRTTTSTSSSSSVE